MFWGGLTKNEEVNVVDNIQSANIQAQTQRVQEIGARSAASLYGAAASGKADELQSKSEAAEPEEKIDLTGKEDGARETADITSQADTENVETYTESAAGEDSSSQQIAEKGVELSQDSIKAAEAMVKQQIKEASPEELSKTKPLGEPKLLDLRLAESVSVAEINDTITGKPLPPVLDDPYCTHTDLTPEEVERITREAEEALKAQQKETAEQMEANENESPVPQEAIESGSAPLKEPAKSEEEEKPSE